MAAGVRVQCPTCTFSVVMRGEGELPEGISKVVEGAAFCPNCDLPMTVVGSVDGEAKDRPGLGEGLSFSERLGQIRGQQNTVDNALMEWTRAKTKAADQKKNYDAQVVRLGSLIHRLTAVPTPDAPLPLFDNSEDPPACAAQHTTQNPEGVDVVVFCTEPEGHDGDHAAGATEGDDGVKVTWPQTAIEVAAAALADAAIPPIEDAELQDAQEDAHS